MEFMKHEKDGLIFMFKFIKVQKVFWAYDLMNNTNYISSTYAAYHSKADLT